MTNLTKSLLTSKLTKAEKAKELTYKANTLFDTFWQRKAFKKGKFVENCMVMMKLVHNNMEINFSTGVKCLHGELDHQTLNVKGSKTKSLKLQEMRMLAHKAFIEMQLTGRNIDLHVIKAFALGLDVAITPTILQCIDLFELQQVEACKVGEIRKSNLRKIKSWNNKLREFILYRYNKNCLIETIVPNDSKNFIFWLRDKKEISNDVAMTYTAHFKRVLNFAVENEWINRNPFLNFRKKMDNKKRLGLTEDEVLAIEKTIIIDKGLSRAKDVYLFMIYTGLSYSDAEKLRMANILKTDTGEMYIHISRTKTNREQTVYLIDKAIKIIAKYQDDFYCQERGYLVPIISNQKTNVQLKAIGAIAGLKKVLTCHLARHTFASIMYNAGANEKVMKSIMGHSSKSDTLFKHYVTVEPQTVVQGMKEAFEKTKLA